jgi:hypothetical protein
MRTFEEAFAAARDGAPFSNSTSWELWSAHWCYRPCAVDAAFQRNDSPDGCPLILVALKGRTPSEWLRHGLDYHCVEFRDDDEPSREAVSGHA